MKQEFKLSAAEHEKIYQLLKNQMLSTSLRRDNPRAVIIGGQPGAGKSKLIDMVIKSFPDNGIGVTVINGDDYRTFHPKHKEIFEADDKKFAERTDPDVREWTKKLFDAAIENRRDIIFEGTMRNIEPLLSTVKRLKEDNYRVEIMILAVKCEFSMLSTLLRYENQKAILGYGRWTPPESHDEAYKNLPLTVARLEKENIADSLSVLNRSGEILYQRKLNDESGFNAQSTLEKERIRHLTYEEQVRYSNECSNIIEKMQERRAADKDIAEIRKLFSASKHCRYVCQS